MTQPSVFLVGDIGHRDFTEARCWLQTHTSLHTFVSLDEALAAVEIMAPDAVVFAESRRGQISQRRVEQFYAAAPLTRLVVLLGSWCEGQQRTGTPLQGVVSIYWHQWTARAAAELLGKNRDGATSWNLPRTTTPGEQILHQSDRPIARGTGLIGVDAASLITFDGLNAACRQGGFASVWLKQVSGSAIGGLSAVIWDAISCDERSSARLRDLCGRNPNVPLLATLDFVRRQDYDNAKGAGASAVLAKPFLIADLLWILRHLTNSAAVELPANIPATQ